MSSAVSAASDGDASFAGVVVSEASSEASPPGEGAEDAGAFTVGRPLAQKAFERELSKVLQASDILVEVLDARDPLGCRCKPLEDAVLTKWQSKRVVLLLNKCDLVPPDVVIKPSNPSPNPDP